MTKQDRSANIEALQLLLETYGADRTRWPAAERLRFAGLIASDPAAAMLVAEALAFDRLLDLAARPSPDTEQQFAARVVAAAMADRTPRSSNPANRRDRSERGVRPWPGWRPAPLEWRAAGLLAASLLVGVFVGTAGVLTPAVDQLAVMAGLDIGMNVQQVVLDDASALLLEEELL